MASRPPTLAQHLVSPGELAMGWSAMPLAHKLLLGCSQGLLSCSQGVLGCPQQLLGSNHLQLLGLQLLLGQSNKRGGG